MSDTPRTDARLMVVTDNDTCKIKVLETVRAPFVRILEREVNALTSERDKLRAEVEKVYALVTPVGFDLPGGIFETAQAVTELRAERDQLRDEVERLKRDYEYDHRCLHEVRERCESWKQRAEAAETVALANWNGALANWNGALERAMKAEAELATAKERLRTEAMDDYAAIKDLQRELASERARLDWLETDAGIDWQWEPSRLTVSRAAIDAAMKEDAK